jgi:hypothetical protein
MPHATHRADDLVARNKELTRQLVQMANAKHATHGWHDNANEGDSRRSRPRVRNLAKQLRIIRRREIHHQREAMSRSDSRVRRSIPIVCKRHPQHELGTSGCRPQTLGDGRAF